MPFFYFIVWVVLMLTAVLAVPIVSMMEKRKLEGPRKKTKDSEDAAASDGEEELQPLGEGEEGIPEEQAIQEADAIPDDSFGTATPDDFSAFEEEFK
jgi:hypothetical protein